MAITWQASFSVQVRNPGEEQILLVDQLPKGLELCVYATTEDAFGWIPDDPSEADGKGWCVSWGRTGCMHLLRAGPWTARLPIAHRFSGAKLRSFAWIPAPVWIPSLSSLARLDPGDRVDPIVVAVSSLGFRRPCGSHRCRRWLAWIPAPVWIPSLSPSDPISAWLDLTRCMLVLLVSWSLSLRLDRIAQGSSGQVASGSAAKDAKRKQFQRKQCQWEG